ncbi:hypothetical protein GCM10009030_21320 [Haloarcula pellucida]|uniref:Uncharacterized protein n=2 Tax=Haloarculaceae TaxID=1963268 RepID=A0A830GMF3_9EURY|nr:hypothetical protein GCM10009030_21320 [Halomicroarcula pellucida]
MATMADEGDLFTEFVGGFDLDERILAVPRFRIGTYRSSVYMCVLAVVATYIGLLEAL